MRDGIQILTYYVDILGRGTVLNLAHFDEQKAAVWAEKFPSDIVMIMEE